MTQSCWQRDNRTTLYLMMLSDLVISNMLSTLHQKSGHSSKFPIFIQINTCQLNLALKTNGYINFTNTESQTTF